MSDPIKHECGIAYVRLRKPLQYFYDRYGDPLWGYRKLSFLMQKQRNRGQDGVGIGCCKLGISRGKRYLFTARSNKRDSLNRLFKDKDQEFEKLVRKGIVRLTNPETVKDGFDFGGENLLGHLRYTTSGGTTEGYCHPQMRESNWMTKSLMVLGNFNLTNVGALKRGMAARGQHPFHDTDTQVVLEEIGFHLDESHDEIYHRYRDEGLDRSEIPKKISAELDITSVIREAAEDWDGGYTIAGVVGNGDGFVIRDPSGIRPCFYFADDEVIAFASERPPLMTVFNKTLEDIKELQPGHCASVKNTGEFTIRPFTTPREHQPCSFERIYFSRGNDADIYKERKALGEKLVPQIVESVDDDFSNTVFSFIPNTAETGYLGLMDGLRNYRRCQVRDQLRIAAEKGEVTEDLLDEVIMNNWPRGEKIAHKDEKFRTFISNEKGRDQMVSLAYDISYGQVPVGGNLVALDDSIVRGTTLRKSVIRILSRTNPKKIVIVSTAPQIRYPDCYGIDMSELGKFLAFQSAIELLKTSGRGLLVKEVYDACLEELKKPEAEMKNCVQAIYEPFTPEELSVEMARQVFPADVPWKGELVLIFQNISNLHDAIPNHPGDWYFTGNYPTPGGYAVVNRAFANFFEGNDGRPYDAWL